MFRKILCPVDGTEHATLALERAVELAGKYGASLTVCVVNVAHGTGRSPRINHWTDEQVAKILSDAVAQAKGAETVQIVAREVGPAIVQYAETGEYDCIVMGTGDKRGLSRLMLGSVAADVSGRAHCSVLVAR
ncbi:universal stress protein [Rhodobacteraceae bacterium HSP-20]|uniref:Universal stress protein n=1 Tax=Paragemmobacter amnigenus TaxID=2852097 RepID=A0ABS6IZB2_9RHOB|nr:universal stress protein [Rhodobacter amnigenus]MBU9696866.1 universal stress protein [Rhodobacter amnigenus]MBV4388093.1 universal stress protein [Rhodobacter amnigenus]